MRLAEARELVRLQPPELDPVKRVIARCHSVEDLRQAARRRLPRAVFDYVDGGADAESTLMGNRTALQRWAFQPQILHDVSAPDLSVELFGRRLMAPLGLAPTGYTRMVNPAGETGVATACAPTGLPYGLSTVGSTSIEDLAATGHPRLWFQLYTLRDRGFTRSLLERASTPATKSSRCRSTPTWPGTGRGTCATGSRSHLTCECGPCWTSAGTWVTGPPCCAPRCSPFPI